MPSPLVLWMFCTCTGGGLQQQKVVLGEDKVLVAAGCWRCARDPVLPPPPVLPGCCGWMLATWKLPAVARFWDPIAQTGWVGGCWVRSSACWSARVYGWMIRILGSYAFGREAMGMGDVHLMAAVGAVLGPGTVTVAFFLAPFFGIIHAIYLLFSKKGRELPLGPYLGLGTAAAMVFYCQIADYLSPGLRGLLEMFSQWLGWS